MFALSSSYKYFIEYQLSFNVYSDSPTSYAASHETNKFDGLCDGALNSVALVNTAMEEVWNFWWCSKFYLFN